MLRRSLRRGQCRARRCTRVPRRVLASFVPFVISFHQRELRALTVDSPLEREMPVPGPECPGPKDPHLPSPSLPSPSHQHNPRIPSVSSAHWKNPSLCLRSSCSVSPSAPKTFTNTSQLIRDVPSAPTRRWRNTLLPVTVQLKNVGREGQGASQVLGDGSSSGEGLPLGSPHLLPGTGSAWPKPLADLDM